MSPDVGASCERHFRNLQCVRPGANSCSDTEDPAPLRRAAPFSAHGRSGLVGFTVLMRRSSLVSSNAFTDPSRSLELRTCVPPALHRHKPRGGAPLANV